MSAKPEAAGSSGISLTASGSGAGGPEDPLGEVRAIFTTIGITIT